MYFKLALRNAKRSIADYLLYIVTMIILLSILFVSNYISIVGNESAGFQTVSLPIFIVMILVLLVGYINNFMLKQRAKEFASYMLLGMEKKTLVLMFLIEFLMIGFFCLIISVFISFGICIVFSDAAVQIFDINNFKFAFFLKGFLQTFIYFTAIELISIYRLKRRVYKLEICELMIEKGRNQNHGGTQKYRFWGIGLGISIVTLLVFICAIIYLPEESGFIFISIIALPIFASVFTFYKYIFETMSSKRQNKEANLYKNERLYLIAKITSETRTNALMNSVFCICLLFSFMSFIFGTIMFQSESIIGDINSQKWMGFLQISICIIFIVIYFSILSLKHIIEVKQQAREMKVLHYIGKNETQIKSLIRKQILIKLGLPAFMCFALLAVSTPLVNYKLNAVLPITMRNIWLESAGKFTLYFLIFYLFYCAIIIIISKKYVGNSINL